MKITLKVEGYQCRCGHQWIPRKPGVPVVCPKCKSPYWNSITKKRKSMRERKVKGGKK